jgi:hypothetical protein
MVPLSVEFDPKDVRRMLRAWDRAPEIMEVEMRAFFKSVTARFHEDVVQLMDMSEVSATGALRTSIIGRVEILPGIGIEAAVGSPLTYAVPVELGTRPHMPPVAPLVNWAIKRLGVRGREAQRAGRAIAFKIAREGTKGKFMFTDAFAENKPQIEAGFKIAVARAIRRIGAQA